MKIHEDDSNSSKANKRVQAGERSGVLYAGNRKKQRKLLQPFGLKKIYYANREMQNVLYTRNE